LFGRNLLPNIRNRGGVTDIERVNDIEQKLRCWGYLSHYPDAQRDVAWLLEKLAERDARIAELEARLPRNKWAFSHARAACEPDSTGYPALRGINLPFSIICKRQQVVCPLLDQSDRPIGSTPIA